jgi:hypothetical protein
MLTGTRVHRIPHIRRIVDRFVATVEKGKSVGRTPVNEEIVEDLLQLPTNGTKLKKIPQEVITSG